MFVPLDIMQHKDRSRLWGQNGHRFFEVNGQSEWCMMRGGIVQFQVIGRTDARLTPLLRTDIHQHDVDSNAVKPRGKRALTAETAEHLPRPHKDILCQFFRSLSTSTHAQTERIDTANVLAVQLLKGLCIAMLSKTNRGRQMVTLGLFQSGVAFGWSGFDEHCRNILRV
jgi:hypothetical protein